MSGGSEKASHCCLLGFGSLLKLGSHLKRDPYLMFAVNCNGSLLPSSKLESCKCFTSKELRAEDVNTELA